MKQRIVYVIVFVFFTHLIQGQIIQGVVYDKTTKEPIYNANVYMEGTSYYTITDDKGKFRLNVPRKINTPLIISHVLYEKQIIGNIQQIPSEIYMQERDNLIENVVIDAKRSGFSNEQKLKAFRQIFLGNSSGGKSCKIENEGDIRLIHDSENKRLIASSEVPLKIKNDYLGYEILFELTHFEANYSSSKSLASSDLQSSIYLGTSSFLDMLPTDVKIQARRKMVYEGSRNQFFKDVVKEQMEQSDFKLYKNLKQRKAEEYFVIEEDPFNSSLIHIILIPEMITHETDDGGAMKLDVVYKGNTSGVSFFTDVITSDIYGNIDQIDKVLFSGDLAKRRVGDMLPLDYESNE
ncbi:carboxypeptidase-like regulatory domain-containing protein [Parabacteroides sp. OttesenSCG-928-G07]|nr:carboxypeptidase-like regulatory domain-containing protein [Parabacteroides sp. OttesenSCG-928-G07]